MGSALRALGNQEPIDEIKLAEILVAKGKLEEVGGYKGINKLVAKAEMVHTYQRYINILIDKYRQREAIRLTLSLWDEIIKPAPNYEEVSKRAQPYLTDLSLLNLVEKEVGLKEVAERVIGEEKIKAGDNPDAIDKSRWVKTGLEVVDKGITPFDPGNGDNLIIIAGMTSEGKSSFVREICSYELRNNKIICAFLLETSRAMFLKQCASSAAEINLKQTWASFRLDPKEKDKEFREKNYFRHLNWLRDRCDERLYLFQGSLSIDEIVAKAREVAAKTGRIDILVVDYLQLVEAGDERLSREQEIAKITRRLKLLASDLQTVAFVACQLNRDVGKDGPNLRNLRESGAIEQHADRVIFVYRPEVDALGHNQKARNKGFQQKIIQAKNREGPLDWEWVTFQGIYTKFKDLPAAQYRGRKKHDKKEGEE